MFKIMIENMVLTLYLDKSYFVASIQLMSRDRLKHQVRGQFLSRDITFLSHRWLRYTMTSKQVNATIDLFLV